MDRSNVLDKEIEELEEKFFGTSEKVSTDDNVNKLDEVEEKKNKESPVKVLDKSEETEKIVSPKETDWKKRYIGIKQSQDATIYSLRTENASLKKQSLALNARLTELEKSSKAPDPFDSLFTDEDKDVLGEEALDIFTKASKAAVDSAVSPLQKKLEIEKQHRMNAQKDSMEKDNIAVNNIFLNKLGNLVPDYSVIDTDPNFKVWMDEPDTYSGFQRKFLFLKAKDIGDVARVAEFFVEFKQVTTSPESMAEEFLEKAMGPDSSSAPAIASKKPGVYRMIEIEQFYDDVSRGKYKGRETLAKDLELKYDKAYSEGRII